MNQLPGPYSLDRRPGGLAAIFRRFGRMEAPQLNSPLYEQFSFGVAGDRDLLALAAHAQPGQPPPNMLYAAVQHLMLRGAAHPLAAHYPALSDSGPAAGEAFSHFRAFCLEHSPEIESLLKTRRVQTNVIQRSVCLLAALATVAQPGQSLALIEVGASAGLNLLWDRYRYMYPPGPRGDGARP